MKNDLDWKDYYTLFEIIVEDYFPDEDRINEHINTLEHIFQNQSGMKEAISRWKETDS